MKKTKSGKEDKKTTYISDVTQYTRCIISTIRDTKFTRLWKKKEYFFVRRVSVCLEPKHAYRKMAAAVAHRTRREETSPRANRRTSGRRRIRPCNWTGLLLPRGDSPRDLFYSKTRVADFKKACASFHPSIHPRAHY